MNLTAAQLEAIQYKGGNLQLIACAGSGKTEVLARRVAELLASTSATPRSIVAFTFTERAAAELKERIVARTKERLGDVSGLAEMYVGTIHGYCLQLLQTHLYRFLKYSVLSDVQTKLLVARNSNKSGLSSVALLSGPQAGQRLRRGPKDVRIYLDALNVLREDVVDRSQLPVGIRAAEGLYNGLLDHHRYLDYSRILVEALSALADMTDSGALRLQAHVRSTVKHVIVDEYQDVNPLQERLIRRLNDLGAVLCVVGDDDQAIYQWRGSEIENILGFSSRYQSVHNITIAENFRSSFAVVDTARAIAETNQTRLPKLMVAAGHQIFERGDLVAASFALPEDEAEWIAKRILELRGQPFIDSAEGRERGLSWADCAILLRSVRKNGEVITNALRQHGIPYVIGGLSNLFDSDEVQAAADLFRYVNGDVTAQALESAWLRSDLGLTGADLGKGVAILDTAKTFKAGERWGAYNLQRTYLDFLEAINLREERVPPTSAGAARGEIVYFNLGKFSQVISDFEQIYFQSEPKQKYASFVWWLNNQAPEFYEEGGEDVGFAQPDAVQLMTVHQAKGMEWPAVFVPAMQRNRFPSTTGGRGRTKWHVLPRSAVADPGRYDGTVEDERRLFYVALTRSKKHLAVSFAPIPDNKLFLKASPFLAEFTRSQAVITKPLPLTRNALEPKPRRATPNVALSFSELKYFFECPYQFKLRFVYGFNAPLHEALGFGKSLHDALAEVHKRALAGEIVPEEEAGILVDDHLHAPFAYPALKEQLRIAAVRAIAKYLREQGPTLRNTLHSEQQVEIQVTPGITVNGRIDLIKKVDTGEVAIVDFKSSERAQAEEITRSQLHTYAIGYRQLTGKDADIVEVLNLDPKGQAVREVVDSSLISDTEGEIRRAGDAIRTNQLPRIGGWCSTCASCDMAGICRKREG